MSAIPRPPVLAPPTPPQRAVNEARGVDDLVDTMLDVAVAAKRIDQSCDFAWCDESAVFAVGMIGKQGTTMSCREHLFIFEGSARYLIVPVGEW